MEKEEIKNMVKIDLQAATAFLHMLLNDPVLLDGVVNHIHSYQAEKAKKADQIAKDKVELDKPHEEVLNPV